MPSYAVMGVSKGIGFEFLRNLSSNPSNTVIGIVRNVAETEAKIASWRTPNIHIVQGNLDDYESLEKAVATTSAITSGTLDVLIASAALMRDWSAFDPFSVLSQEPSRLTTELMDMFNTNVVGNIHLINLFMPLILKGNLKKVIAITSGMADTSLVVRHNIYEGAPYSISKAALNMAVAKFQAEYEKDGVLFMAVCPGAVNTGQYDTISEEMGKKLMVQGEKFKAYAPHFEGPASPDEAAKDVLSVVEKATLRNGNAGAYVSHFGNKQWL